MSSGIILKSTGGTLLYNHAPNQDHTVGNHFHVSPYINSGKRARTHFLRTQRSKYLGCPLEFLMYLPLVSSECKNDKGNGNNFTVGGTGHLMSCLPPRSKKP